ncbi:hypothetical protein BCR39DRAFT_524607 [Naematelia encephala]|uniref:Uncharacterized protein n=1 Tax=Naematelia encephala TaxID=71784 RepID=A0A1Y2BBJ9_9TREE|nr:hypothetical protein BCR39DRAFT_524607 [Naematelia encephala]
MQSLLSGADCSTASNPLKQITQREGVDQSLFRDRVGPSSGPSNQAFRPIPSGPAQAIQPLRVNPTPHPFNLSHLSSALAASTSRHASPQFDAEWERASIAPVHRQPPPPALLSAEYQSWTSPSHTPSPWVAAFATNGKGKGREAIEQSMPAAPYRPYMPSIGYQPTFQPMYSGYQQQQPIDRAVHHYGRSETEQKDMEAAFERALEDARLQRNAEVTQEQPAEGVREAKGDFDAVWESLKPEAERLNKLAEWESDFSQFVSDEDDLFETLNDSLNRPDVGQTGLDDQLEFGSGEYLGNFLQSDDGLPAYRPYEFSDSHQFDHMSATAAWAEGNRILASGGSLSDATGLLEFFIQQAKMDDYNQLGITDVEAWSLLGKTHAMNEKESRAMEAFEQGRKALEGEDSGREKVAGELLINLAISYVNESLDLAALTILHQFLTLNHPSHTTTSAAPSRHAISESTSPWAIHQSLTDAYLALAREQYAKQGIVDPDVQVGLGTLYYMMGEYDQARDCWVAALGERPNDYLLWNRLGATLANGGNPEEAVDAYRRALELKPTFTRAIFNLGVACLNIGVYREAAEHFLAALSMHQRDSSNPEKNRDGNNTTSNVTGMYESGGLWNTLRRALSAMDMPDLAEEARPGTDLEVFRLAGFEF